MVRDASSVRRPLNFDSLGKIVAGLTRLVALVTGIVSLVYLLSSDTPPQRKATLSIAKVIGQTSLKRYLLDSGQSDRVIRYGPEALDAPGNYYYLDAKVEGLHGRNPEIFWSLNDADDNSRFEDPAWIHQRFASIKPPANNYGFVAKVWIQHPRIRGKYYAIIEIDYPSDQTLSTASTPPFLVQGSPAAGPCVGCPPPRTPHRGLLRPPASIEPSH